MHRARLLKRARLSRAADFKKVFEKGVRSSDRYFTILVRPNDFEFPRLGLAISKKRAKHAVTRNRLKRLIRESFRHNQHRLCCADFVVVGGQRCAHANNSSLVQSLDKHWQKLEKLCAKS